MLKLTNGKEFKEIFKTKGGLLIICVCVYIYIDRDRDRERGRVILLNIKINKS